MRELVNDINLMAYADGELDTEAAAEVEAAARRDAEVQIRLEAFQLSRTLLHTAYNGPIHQPVPERLAQALAGPEIDAPGEARADKVVPLRRPARPYLGWAAAAAAAALVFGFGGGQYWQSAIGARLLQQAQSAAALSARAQAVNLALEALPNGRSIPWMAPGGGNGAIMPVETYLDANGAYCRQYIVTLTRDGIADEWHETACRRDAGDWRPERATENGA